MKKQEFIKDPLIRKVCENKINESPSMDFTVSLMEKIHQLPVTEKIETKHLSDILKWIFLSLFLFVGCIFFILFDFRTFEFRDIVLNFSFLNNISVAITNWVHQINKLLNFLRQFSVVVPFLIAIPFLIGFDKLINKPQTGKMYSIF
ncbi:MAG: hypothetical protein M0R21_01620 [Lentimicrobiaceae bacterium]|jgi:hypothetical protein|nr:hypothetical protein [Lentimicrobiaceae bacterium]